MSEFKGTKGKWKLHKHAFACVVSDESSLLVSNCGGRTSNVNGDELYIEQQANALLISKAPEMLEMLKKAKIELCRIKLSMMAHPDCVEGSEFDDYTESAQECEDEIEQLIKEATEL